MNSVFTTCQFNTEQETTAFASALAPLVRCQDLIRLTGDLGSGKSFFARALIQAMGNSQAVPSPTFTLVQMYDDGRIPVAHLDCYRMEDPDELETLDIAPFRKHGLVVVEWPEKAGDALGPNQPELIDYYHCTMDNAGVLTLNFKTLSPTARTVEISASPCWQRRLAQVLPHLQRPTGEAHRQKFLAQQGWRGHVPSLASGKEAWSTRSYWRFNTDAGPRVLMDAAPPVQQVEGFIEVQRYLKQHGVRVPHVYLEKSDPEQGYLVLEDLGSRILQTENTHSLHFKKWLELSVDLLGKLARLKAPTWRSYNATDMWLEVARFTDYYLPQVRGHATHTADRQAFFNIWQPLFAKIQAVPSGFMHSDYHAGNLLLLNETPSSIEDIGLIDFQDASCGPISYDIASFLWNDRVPFDEALRQQLLQRFLRSLDTPLTEQQLLASAELVVVQRMLKIIGGITKLAVQKNRTDLMALTPRCFNYITPILERREDLAELRQWWNKLVPSTSMAA